MGVKELIAGNMYVDHYSNKTKCKTNKMISCSPRKNNFNRKRKKVLNTGQKKNCAPPALGPMAYR